MDLEGGDWNEFLGWLDRLDHDEVSISLEGALIRFRTKAERSCFVIGFEKCWAMLEGYDCSDCNDTGVAGPPGGCGGYDDRRLCDCLKPGGVNARRA